MPQPKDGASLRCLAQDDAVYSPSFDNNRCALRSWSMITKCGESFMRFSSWLKSLRSAKRTSRLRANDSGSCDFRPCLENLENRLAPTASPINVITYGATGNGTTDDTAAVQAAINAAGSGGVVYFPAGSYNLSSGLLVDNSGVTLEGAGMSASTLLAPLSTTANALDIGAANVTITNLGINGRYTQQPAPTGQGQEGIFLATGSVNDTISNCWIYNTVGSGVINVGGTAGSNLTVQGCDITNLGTAFSLAVGTPTTTSIAVRTGQGALFSVGQTVQVAASSTIQSATTTSITVTNGTGATFVAGQALNVAGTTVTVSSITGDTLNLASALSSAPAAGQTVYQSQSSTVTAISGDTLTVALGYAPQAGDIVSSAGAYGAINGIFLGGSVQGANILNNYIAGWSQAIGLWYGVQNTLVEGNTIIDNYAYQNQSFSIPRSAIELYPNTDVGGNNRVLNNVVDGGAPLLH